MGVCTSKYNAINTDPNYPDYIEDTPIDDEAKCNNKKCIYNILKTLKCYQDMNVIDNTYDNINKLFKFIDEECNKNLIDDYIHIIIQHDDIELLEYKFDACNIRNCLLAVRHFRNREEDKEENYEQENVGKFMFWRDLFDSIHCYMFHLFDFGYRMKQTNHFLEGEFSLAHMAQKSCSEFDGEKYIDCVDTEFDDMCRSIRDKRNILQALDGYDRTDINKFNIIASTEQKFEEDEITFMDGLCEYLECKKQVVKQFIQFMNEEDFDSDVIFADIEDYNNSNIAFFMKDDINYFKLVKQYSQESKQSDNSFSIGFIFYYWDYYKTRQNHSEQQIDSIDANINDHSGYEPHELYISKKYQSMKIELLNNTIHRMDYHQYKTAYTKASEMMYLKKVKRTIAADVDEELHYGIEPHSHLSIHHLLSVILYCDYSDISRELSATFRRVKSFEKLASMKKRNREFFNFSKKLRETVQYFGDDRRSGKLKGPFYCGMPFKMIMPSFNIRLCSPTSTSMKMEVATSFAGNDGIVIELNNNGDNNSQFIRSFNCSWISSYNGEDERLFFGGYYRLKLETIRVIKSCHNFGWFFKRLYYFDCMITGTNMEYRFDETIINVKDYMILNNLIKHKLSDAFMNGYPQYVNDTFDVFCNHKRQIIIHSYFLNINFSQLTPLIMKRDIFTNVMFNLFKNIDSIIVYSSNYDGKYDHPFHLLTLLNVINTSFIISSAQLKVTIKATWKETGKVIKKRSWIYHAFSAEIIKQYNKKNLNILLQTTTNAYHEKEDCLIITKL